MLEKTQEEIENKIIDLIALESESRLVVFKPEKSNKDLVVEKRGDYEKKPVFLNVYWVETHGKDNFIAKISQIINDKNFIPEENFYLIFAKFDVVAQKIYDDFFVVPSLKVNGITKNDDLLKYSMNDKDFIRLLIDLSEK